MRRRQRVGVGKCRSRLHGPRHRDRGRPGERHDEFIVGEMELPSTRKYVFDGVPHYAISFNQPASEPIEDPMSSADVERLNDAELRAILDAAPADEEMW